MSIKLSEYFVYGILVPYNWYKEWEEKNHRNFHSAFADYIGFNAENDIACLFDNRDEKFIIIGKILEKVNNDNPIIIPELDDINMELIRYSIKSIFGLEGDFHYYFVKKYI